MTARYDSECDYCGEETGTFAYMRAVGFTEYAGSLVPQVKVHCGSCPTGDDIDPAAAAAVRGTFAAQAGRPLPDR